jgi:predicted molibdopterin-dependent oxidoreductase YjgC
LSQPLVNRNGKLEPVSWAEALDHVAGRIKELIEAGKPVGVLGSARATNEENYLAGKLARAGFHTNHLDFSYHSICGPLLKGLEEVCGECPPSISLNDVESSQTILLIEGDLAKTHPRAASAVMAAVEKGAHLITIAHTATQMSRLASLPLPAVPGNEGEVIDGLLAAVLHFGLEDQTSVKVHCEGFHTLRRDLEGAKITAEMRQAAEWITRATRATFLIPPVSGEGPPSHRESTALATLAAVTGHLGRPGSGLLPLLARCNVRGACDMGIVPDRLPGYRPLADKEARQRLEGLWGKDLPSTPGLDAESMLQSVSALIVLADDPPAVLPSGQRAKAALGKVEFLVVLDAFLTPTAQMAHVVLPMASFAETDGTITNMEGRVQRLHVATDPPGEARPGWQILAELCARFELCTAYRSALEVLNEVGCATPKYRPVCQGEDKWGGIGMARASNGWKFRLLAAEAPRVTLADGQHVLVRDGDFDWGRDPLVAFSPTLSRDFQSERKLFPSGYVEMCKQDADAVGVHPGRPVKLTSAQGEAVIPTRVRADLKPGVLLVPYAFRDHLANVLGTHSVTAVKVEQA